QGREGHLRGARARPVRHSASAPRAAPAYLPAKPGPALSRFRGRQPRRGRGRRDRDRAHGIPPDPDPPPGAAPRPGLGLQSAGLSVLRGAGGGPLARTTLCPPLPRAPAGPGMRRLGFPALLAWVALAAGAVLWSGWQLWGMAVDNRAIRSLAGGSDVALRQAADPRAAHARALFLVLRDRPQVAETLLAGLATAPPGLRSEYHYAIGNARMRMGFERIERNR